MIGVAYNPANCAFISNQAVNANQFNGNVPYSSNPTTHLVLWDFIDERLYWVNSQTNIIEAEIPGSSACNFIADISYFGTVTPPAGPVGRPAEYYRYVCAPINGNAPYTFQWSLKSGPNNNYSIVGSTTNSYVDLNLDVQNLGYSLSYLQCKVTDANGCITSATFLAHEVALA